MKKIIILFSVFLLSIEANGQDTLKVLKHLNFMFGKTYSTLKFQDNEGNPNENISYISGNAYSVNLNLPIGKRHVLRPEIIFYEAGASSEFLQIKESWKLNYLGFRTSYLFNILNKKNISLSPGIALGYDYLYKGEQIIGSTRYNLIENKILKNWDMNGGLLLNTCFKVTETFSVSFEYRYNLGLIQIEKKDDGEMTKNRSHLALLGLSFNL
jgi:hypothetical protein